MDDKILIVDDEEVVVQFIAKLLQSWGYESFSACNGKEAIQRARKNATIIKLIILDIDMPGMDGFETIRCIKKDQNLAPIPVIFLTGRFDGEADMTKGMRLYAQSYLTKPIQFDQFHRAVDNLLNLARLPNNDR